MPKFDSIDHLNFEAVAALIDDELTPTALHRAQQHLLQCPDCRREVAQQRAAADAVREHNTDGCLRAPRSLVERLSLLDEHPAPSASAGRSIPAASTEPTGRSASSSRDTTTRSASAGRDASAASSAPAGRDASARGTAASSRRSGFSGLKWPISWSRLRDGLR